MNKVLKRMFGTVWEYSVWTRGDERGAENTLPTFTPVMGLLIGYGSKFAGPRTFDSIEGYKGPCVTGVLVTICGGLEETLSRRFAGI